MSFEYDPSHVDKLKNIISKHDIDQGFMQHEGVNIYTMYMIQHTHDLGMLTCDAIDVLLQNRLYPQALQVLRPYFETCAYLLWSCCAPVDERLDRANRILKYVLLRKRKMYQGVLDFREEYKPPQDDELKSVKLNIEQIDELLKPTNVKPAPNNLFDILKNIEKWEHENYKEAKKGEHSRLARYHYVVQGMHTFLHVSFNYFLEDNYIIEDDRAIKGLCDAIGMYAMAVQVYSGSDPYGGYIDEMLMLFGQHPADSHKGTEQ